MIETTCSMYYSDDRQNYQSSRLKAMYLTKLYTKQLNNATNRQFLFNDSSGLFVVLNGPAFGALRVTADSRLFWNRHFVAQPIVCLESFAKFPFCYFYCDHRRQRHRYGFFGRFLVASASAVYLPKLTGQDMQFIIYSVEYKFTS